MYTMDIFSDQSEPFFIHIFGTFFVEFSGGSLKIYLLKKASINKISTS